MVKSMKPGGEPRPADARKAKMVVMEISKSLWVWSSKNIWHTRAIAIFFHRFLGRTAYIEKKTSHRFLPS